MKTKKYHSLPHISRYDLDRTAFSGWRVCVTRKQRIYTKYFPDRRYDSNPDASLAAAKECLKQVMAYYIEHSEMPANNQI